MRRYQEPAKVRLTEGVPVMFVAWNRPYQVEEVLFYWEESEPWWTPENASKPWEELRVRHYQVVARRLRAAEVELVQRGARGWFVEGVAD
ncbi:hypothetical protein DQ384_05330 [Sphaerisporangium album]|uniref:Uncharacterized protein n=1 Tax=Sphaerisporangium album TaxID=509200 RepID=A0A367FQS5_9ACTN|nr:hypothetical protein [Sphaerisporangium album]RCG31965.1 hypothetical protein DQ384_05330 [Sphaerisporangium album]